MIIDTIYADLGGPGSVFNGTSFGLSQGNTYTLRSSPNLWNHNPAVFDYAPCSADLLDGLEELVASARATVDISTLAPLPNDLFLARLRSGLARAARLNPRLVVRLLEGGYPFHDDPSTALMAWITSLALPNTVSVYVGSMHRSTASWNHSKLVIVDGQRALCGGHNMWTQVYCEFAPIHDVSIVLSGPAVEVAQNFLNLQWIELANRRGSGVLNKNAAVSSIDGHFGRHVLVSIVQPKAPEATGGAAVLALGRIAWGMVEPGPVANASRTARLRAVSLAKSSVKMSQQMLGAPGLFSGGWDQELMEALAACIARDVAVTIIISDTGAGDYVGYSVAQTALDLKARVGRKTGIGEKALEALMARNCHVGPVRFYPRQPGDPAAQSWKWRKPGVTPVEPGNHAKVYIVDDELFYVGSDNAYRILNNDEGLLEFGFLISGHAETSRFLTDYWTIFWSFSQQFEFTHWAATATEDAL